MDTDFGDDDGDSVMVTVPSELVRRIVMGAQAVMREWFEGKSKENAVLISITAMQLASDYMAETALSAAEDVAGRGTIQ